MNVGAAGIDITPDFPTDLSGYGLRRQPATGVLAPIFARAVFVEAGGGERLLWITCDVIAFEREFVDGVRAWAKRQLALEPRQVLLAATHTHFAPATIELAACGARSARYVDLLRERVEDVARRAAAKAEPCDLVVARAECDLAVDRRRKPSAHVDHAVWAVGFRRPGGGDFLAAVLNYTMHPVSHGHGERRITPDWCGAAADQLAELLPGRPVVAVTNGAAGNINPPATDQPAEVVVGYGRAIADSIAPALLAAAPQPSPRLAVRSVSVPVELEWQDEAGIDRTADAHLAALAKSVFGEAFGVALSDWRAAMKQTVGSGGGRTRDIEIQAVRLGGVTIVAVNGEMFTRFTDYVRRGAPTSALFTVAYANAAYGYIPTRQAYGEGGYEVETAHFFYRSFRPQPGSLELLAERAAELVKDLDRGAAAG